MPKTVAAHDETRVDFGDVKVIERRTDEEVVYETEIGAPVPIWAAKKPAAPATTAQRPGAAVRKPPVHAPQSRPPAPSRRPAAPYPEEIPEVPAEPVAQQPPRHAAAPRRGASPAPAPHGARAEESAEPDLDGFMKRIDEVRRR